MKLRPSQYLLEADPDATLGGGSTVTDVNPYLADDGAGEWMASPDNAAPAAEVVESDDVLAGLDSITGEPKEPETVVDPAPVVKPAEAYSRKELRGKWEETETKLKELEGTGQQLTAKYEAATKEAEALRQQLAERDAAYVAKSIPDYDPLKDSELQEIGKGIGSTVQSTVPFLNSPRAQSLVSAQLPAIMEGFTHHLAAGNIAPFKKMIEERMFTQEQLDQEPEECAADIKEIMGMCRKLHPDHVRYQTTLAKNQETWDQRREQNFAEKAKSIDAKFNDFGNWTEDQIKADPKNPAAIISGLMRANPKVAAEIKAMAAHHRTLAAGPKPLPRNPSPAQMAAHRAQTQQFQKVQENAAENALYMNILPGLVAHLYEANQKLLKRVGGSSSANRPQSSPSDARPKPLAPIVEDISKIKNPYV